MTKFDKQARVVRASIIGIVTVTALAIAGSIFIPAPQQVPVWQFYASLVLCLVIAGLMIGSSLLFALAFGSFKGSHYFGRIIISSAVTCLGLALFGLSFLHIPWEMLQGRAEVDYSTAINLPFCLGMIIIYFGNRSITPLFGIKSLAQRLWFALAAIVALSGLLAFISYGPGSGMRLTGQIVYSAISIVLTALASVTIWQVKRAIGTAYIERFAWVLLASIIHLVAIGVVNTLIVAIIGYQPTWALLWVVLLPTAISSIFFLYSSYMANNLFYFADTQERAVARNFFGKPLQPKNSGASTSLDIVMFAANLISNPARVDNILNRVRAVTANMQAGRQALPEDEQVFKGAYLEIEKFLVEKEPLRSVTRENLRRIIAQNLHLTASDNNFWNSLD